MVHELLHTGAGLRRELVSFGIIHRRGGTTELVRAPRQRTSLPQHAVTAFADRGAARSTSSSVMPQIVLCSTSRSRLSDSDLGAVACHLSARVSVVDSRRELPTTSTCRSSERIKIVDRRSLPDSNRPSPPHRARALGTGAAAERHAGQVDPMTALIKHGMLLQSAHGPLPNVAEMIAGEPIRGSWWNHPASRSIFDALNLLAESPDVVRMRLVNGKVTLVHRRLWPALVRIADRFPAKNLAAIHEEHTASGAHRVQAEAFPDWVPNDVLQAAKALSVEDALTELPAYFRRS